MSLIEISKKDQGGLQCGKGNAVISVPVSHGLLACVSQPVAFTLQLLLLHYSFAPGWQKDGCASGVSVWGHSEMPGVE